MFEITTKRIYMCTIESVDNIYHTQLTYTSGGKWYETIIIRVEILCTYKPLKNKIIYTPSDIWQWDKSHR